MTNFINRTKAHHTCHWAEALLCNNDTPASPNLCTDWGHCALTTSLGTGGGQCCCLKFDLLKCLSFWHHPDLSFPDDRDVHHILVLLLQLIQCICAHHCVFPTRSVSLPGVGVVMLAFTVCFLSVVQHYSLPAEGLLGTSW